MVLGNALFKHDKLYTIIVEIEGTLNGKPLTYVKSDLEEEKITPSNML